MADFSTLNILNLRYDWSPSITLCHHQPVTGADTPKTTALRFVHVVEKFVWGLRVIISKSKKNEDEEITRDDLLKEIGQLKVENEFLKKKYNQLME